MVAGVCRNVADLAAFVRLPWLGHTPSFKTGKQVTHVVVIGAGGGGLAAAAQLARAGLDVTILEAHIYAGGSAGTFYHQGYRFDAGATLAGGFASSAPLDWIGEQLEIDWQIKLAERAMQVHLSDGTQVTRWTDTER